jgi:hypothetical protein
MSIFFRSRFCIWVKKGDICLSELGLYHWTWWSPAPSIFLQMILHNFILFFSFFFFAVLQFELGALCLLGRCTTSWVMPPALFHFSYFSDRISHFLPSAPSDHNHDLPTFSSYIGGITCVHDHAQSLIFLYGWIILWILYVSHFLYSSVFGYLGWFHSLVISDSAAVNMGVQLSLMYVDLHSFECMPKSGITGSDSSLGSWF